MLVNGANSHKISPKKELRGSEERSYANSAELLYWQTRVCLSNASFAFAITAAFLSNKF